MERVSKQLTDKLAENGAVRAEDRELVAYGIRQGAALALNLATVLLLGFVFGVVWQSILFIAAYVPLRTYAGGYHSRTYLRCYISSVSMLLVITALLRYVEFGVFFLGPMLAVSASAIFFMAPQQDQNKPLDELERRIFRKRTRLVLVLESSIAVIALFLNKYDITVSICLAAAAVAVLLAAGRSSFGGTDDKDPDSR